MNRSFKQFLIESGVAMQAISVLEEEDVLTQDTFFSLDEKHFNQLLLKMKVGHHVRLRCVHRSWHSPSLPQYVTRIIVKLFVWYGYD
jgi:hypothetical protein